MLTRDSNIDPHVVDAGEASSVSLDDNPLLLLRRAYQRASARYSEFLAEDDLTPSQFSALARLHEHGRLSQNLLGRLAAMDPATIQGVIRRLTKRGLVERVPDNQDRRRMVLSLTASGERLVKRLLTRTERVSTEVLGNLGEEERRQLRSLLKRIV